MPLNLADYPRARFHREANLLTWHPIGVLDDALADRMVDFLEQEEESAAGPIHRYTDLNGLSEIRLQLRHTSRIAERRRTAYQGPQGVKSAFCCEWVFGFGIAKAYEDLMAEGPIRIRAFRARENAASWLGVDNALLAPPQ